MALDQPLLHHFCKIYSRFTKIKQGELNFLNANIRPLKYMLHRKLIVISVLWLVVVLFSTSGENRSGAVYLL